VPVFPLLAVRKFSLPEHESMAKIERIERNLKRRLNERIMVKIIDKRKDFLGVVKLTD